MTSVCVRCKHPEATACIYHPGTPIFHDGLKGYSCCSKRVVDFDAFLTIEGCQSTTSHTEKIEQQQKPAQVPMQSQPKQEPIKQPTQTKNPLIPTQTQERKVEIKDDPEGYQPQMGMECQRLGCHYAYDGESTDCSFHKGVPLFHEGSKGYTCCKRKVLEFDEFMKLPGCTTGKHMYTKPIKMARHDWYQSLHEVHVSIFAKNVLAEALTVEFGPSCLKMSAPDMYFDIDLFQEINTTKSSYKVLKSKIEVTLVKQTGMSWPSLDASDQKVFTTFGASGSGTIGGKEAKIEQPTYSK